LRGDILMDELNKKREEKLLNSRIPDIKLIQDMVDQSVEFISDHSEVMELENVSMDQIFNLRPEEILSIKQVYIQKVIAFKTNFIAVGEWMGEDAKLYSIMYASRNPDAFIFDVKEDFGIEIKR
jgi:hypothetical protein